MSDHLQAKLFEDDTPDDVQVETSVSVTGQQRCVLVPYPVDKAYDYCIPEGMDVQDGDYVSVPLSGREVPGVVWAPPAGDVPTKKLKSVVLRYDIDPMPKVHRKFIEWVAHYTMAPLGSVLKMALSSAKALEQPKPIKAYKIVKSLVDADLSQRKGFTPQRKKVLEIMRDGHARRASEVAELAGCSPAVVTGMHNADFLECVEIHSAAPCRKPDLHRSGPTLSQAQALASSCVTEHLRTGGFRTMLLDGVTGAGKTEVYFEGVAEALKQDRQVLILLPEIALSNAFLDRFQKRFGCAPALWHSHLTPAQRVKTWRGVAQGETKVVIGARSALFLPYANLGFIVVDEEHDPAYKQEDNVIYNARDMAIVRANLGQIPIVLVSATPSLESIYNAWPLPLGLERYEHLHLPDRHGGARLPEISLIDMRVEKPPTGQFISQSLREAVKETVENDQQALLFLNRRGYAPLTLCRSCGHRMECPRCTAWLVEHKSRRDLQCHHCGYHCRVPDICPECEDVKSLAACGPGVERIYEEARQTFEDVRIAVLASDTADDDQTLKAMLEDIKSHKVDIIIGTQIIAKGHHFPNLTCVGVVDADLGLQGGDLRAAERTYQLLHQVAGRAGREEKKGHVYLQTFMPEHKIMQALSVNDHEDGRNRFLQAESVERAQSRMPPYSRLAGIIIAGRDEGQVVDVAKALGKSAPQGEVIQTLGPAPAPMARLRGRYRYRLLVRAEKKIDIQKALAEWMKQVKVPSTVRVYIDIDPQSFM